jgi:hypothetical protein
VFAAVEHAAPGRGRAPDWSRLWGELRRPVALALSVCVVLRVVTTVVALDAAYGVSFPHVVARTPSVLVDVWAHWDTGYYLTIAQHGYPAATAAQLHAGTLPNTAAFAPAYPWFVWLAHAVGFGWIAATQVVAALALFVALVGMVRLLDGEVGAVASNATVTLVAAFPTAFFLLAGYPESLALAFVVWAFVAARRGRYLVAGVLAAAAAMTVFYLGVVVLAILYEIWAARAPGERSVERLRRDGLRAAATVVPAAVSFAGWMAVCDHLYADPLAFVRVQRNWGRHFAFPWTLVHHTVSDLVHWRFLDTSTASVTELFDAVTVLVLAAVTVVVFLRVRRSYGVLLGASLCLFVFQDVLYSETREVLVLFPFFVGLARWVGGHPWRERLVLALFIPSAYFLASRFVTGAFAG